MRAPGGSFPQPEVLSWTVRGSAVARPEMPTTPPLAHGFPLGYAPCAPALGGPHARGGRRPGRPSGPGHHAIPILPRRRVPQPRRLLADHRQLARAVTALPGGPPRGPGGQGSHQPRHPHRAGRRGHRHRLRDLRSSGYHRSGWPPNHSTGSGDSRPRGLLPTTARAVTRRPLPRNEHPLPTEPVLRIQRATPSWQSPASTPPGARSNHYLLHSDCFAHGAKSSFLRS